MKSHLLLLRAVLNDMGTRCCTSTSRDLRTVTARLKDEGNSFLGITLPAFCQDFQKCLDSGKVDSTVFVGYAKTGCLPRFLSGFTSLVFDKQTGCLLPEPNVDAIFAVRQITLLHSKVKIPCSDARNLQALVQFVETEQLVREVDARLDSFRLERFERVSNLLFGEAMSAVDRDVYDGSLVPKHGPGKTADRLLGNAKYDQKVWTERLDSVFPFEENALPSWNPLVDSLDTHYLEPGQELPVKVTLVPKTLKTPRVIAIEPTCMQYMQQAVKEALVRYIESNDCLSMCIGFDDQIPNQEMARIGSLDGSLATLDLSEASDRVSNQVVRRMANHWRHFGAALDATRSRKADVPGFGVLRLAKFASMGSALCFPIEAMVFLSIIFCGIEEESKQPFLKSSEFLPYLGKVRVYGDDIVVPVECVHRVIRELEAFGLKVNSDKSFWTGKFRESCGKEYYDGVDVTSVKVREILPTGRGHALSVVSTVSLRNLMYFAGSWITADYLDSHLKQFIPLPMVLRTSEGLGRHSYLGHSTERECRYLQRPLVRAYVVEARPPVSHLEGRPALLKFFLKRGDLPSADVKHLERAGRPEAVYIKLRWVLAD